MARAVTEGDGRAVIGAGPYSIGSDRWPGLAKAAEECGELIQVIGKIIAAGGASEHWDGSDLSVRLEDEIADVEAALGFLCAASGLQRWRITARAIEKRNLFERWHREHRDGSLNRDAIDSDAGQPYIKRYRR